MESTLDLNRLIHMTFGFIGLAAFWVPVFVRKGGPLHRSAGKIFCWCAIVVLTGAGIAVVGNFLDAMARGVPFSESREGWAFLIFLGYLALVTGVSLSHGIAVLKHKRDATGMDSPYRRFIGWAAILSSVVVIGWALYWRPANMIVLLALSPIGFATGMQVLQVISGKRNEPGLWKLEHLNAMLGCGIAFHTAFAVFGINRVTDYSLPGLWQVVPWVLPAAIGIPATSIWMRRERAKFARSNPHPA
ncbi:hypothetical protein [Halomonas denitrificans]|nr:hypothetical protein [Halomonas denitrificans]